MSARDDVKVRRQTRKDGEPVDPYVTVTLDYREVDMSPESARVLAARLVEAADGVS